jgi:hypothetical protein
LASNAPPMRMGVATSSFTAGRPSKSYDPLQRPGRSWSPPGCACCLRSFAPLPPLQSCALVVRGRACDAARPTKREKKRERERWGVNHKGQWSEWQPSGSCVAKAQPPVATVPERIELNSIDQHRPRGDECAEKEWRSREEARVRCRCWLVPACGMRPRRLVRESRLPSPPPSAARGRWHPARTRPAQLSLSPAATREHLHSHK